MKVAVSYTTKNKPELVSQSLPRVALNPAYDLHIVDGSDAVWRPSQAPSLKWYTFHSNIRGGADAALAFSLSMMLSHKANYTHVGIVEMDVLLDTDWYAPTMELFEKGKRDGLEVGAVSPRSYVDRILVQRDDYAICHNLGAGVIIFSREAAQLVLRYFRTSYWPVNRWLFAQLSGIDLATYACFRGQPQFVTSDWFWEAVLARHGLAALALTPAKCEMIGQIPPLSEQGLELTTGPVGALRNDVAFAQYRDNLARVRNGQYRLDEPGIIHRENGGMLFFAIQLGYLAGGAKWQGNLELKWSQGFGVFAYRAGLGGASLSLRVSGSCSYLLSGGAAGAGASLTDTRSGFNTHPDLPPEQGTFIEVSVPGGPVPRTIEMKMGEGAVFYGLQTADPQVLDTSFSFSWDQLPEAK